MLANNKFLIVFCSILSPINKIIIDISLFVDFYYIVKLKLYGILNQGEGALNKTAKEIIEKLENLGYSAYIVGGYVRDFLMNKTSFDIDICTSAKVKEILEIIPGIANEYGSINIKIKELNIDITTFREEKNYENRRPTSISYTKNLKTDLLRRDFTINTICMDKNEKILDLLNGVKDLEKRQIKMIGDPKRKLKEDPLRILRAVRFATILDFTLEENLKEEIMNQRELLATLSTYRIKEELTKILLSPNYKKGLVLLKELCLCEFLGIEFLSVTYTKDVCGMWAQIKTKRNLPFTKSEKKNIVNLHKILEAKVITLETLYNYGLYLSLVAGKILGIEEQFIHTLYESMPIYTRSDMQISYQEICELFHFQPSRKIKEMEKDLVIEVLNSRVENKKDELRKYLLEQKSRCFE